LQDLAGVIGVHGACVVNGDGKVLASTLAPEIPAVSIETVGRTFTRTLEALRVARRRKVQDVDLLYEGGRLVVKNLGEGCLIIYCTPGINVPLLNLTANVIARKIQERMKAKTPAAVEGEQEAAPTGAVPASVEAPPAPAVVEPMPAPVPAPTLVQAPSAAAPAPAAAGISPARSKAEAAALALVEKGRDNKLILRAMGEVALRLRSPAAGRRVPQSPETADMIELAVRGNQMRQIERLLVGEGFVPNTRFNTLQGSQRMRFAHPQTNLFVELFLDSLISYHRLEFAQRLHLDEYTLALADLLLTRLLNVKATDAELQLICCLFYDADLGGPGQSAAIDTTRIVEICADDWGWYKTVTTNLSRCAELAAGVLSSEESETAVRRIRRLHQMLEEAPKSLRWRTRARVGESRRWYEEVD
jgi:predicted regulator of Ras-like GTPase activity (Roadblock/LC7/MglB family)